MGKTAKKGKNQTKKNKKAVKSNNYFMWLLKNVIAAGFAILLITKIIVPRDCYYTVRQLRNDMNIVQKFPKPETPLDDRYLIVMREGFAYLQQLRDYTPENAVILYPEYDDFFPANGEKLFGNGGISSKMWAIRFLYPRIVIQPSELKTSPYKDKITHVAIVNGRGFQYLHYEIEKFSYGVLPIDATEEEIQIMKKMKKNK